MGFFTYYVACLASMGGFLFGWDTGQISDLMIMTDFTQRFAQYPDPEGPGKLWNSWINGLVVALFSAGAIAGAIFGAPFNDRFGRRISIVLGCIVFTIGIIVQVASQHGWVQMGVGRCIVGFSVGWLSSAVPTYQAETVPRQVRGALVGTYQFFITIGILLSYCACYGTRNYYQTAQWRIPIAIGFAWGLILGVGIMFCPESPRWLAKRGRYDEMRKVLAKMRGVDESDSFVVTEYYEIKQEVEEELAMRKLGWLDCFKMEQKALNRTLLGYVLQMGQQLTGANYFFYFGATVFKPVHVMGDDPVMNSYISQIILGVVNVFCTIPGLIALDRLGRRFCLLWGAAWMALWLLIFASVGAVYSGPNGNIHDSQIGILMICCTCFFILGFASTWGPGIWAAITEITVPELRAKQMAIATMSNWTWNFLLAFFTTPITRNIHYYYGYVFFGCCIANFIIVYLFLYETSNLDLENVQVMYMDPKVKPWNSRKWVPPGYTSRREVAKELSELQPHLETVPREKSNNVTLGTTEYAEA